MMDRKYTKPWQIAALNGISLVRGGDGSTEEAFGQGAVESGSPTAAAMVQTPEGVLLGGGNVEAPARVTSSTTTNTVQLAGQQTPGRVFTEEEVARIRKEEKDKLYGKMSEMEQSLQRLEEERKAREEAERAAAEAAEQARLAEERAKMTAEELIQQTAQEWEQKLNTVQEQLAQRDALLEMERKHAQLAEYKQAKLAEQGDYIVPHLRDFVTGNTPEEIDQSIAVLVEKSNAIVNDFQQVAAQQQRSVRTASAGNPPVGPMENQAAQQTITAADIRNMPMDEYMARRAELLRAASAQGPYG